MFKDGKISFDDIKYGTGAFLEPIFNIDLYGPHINSPYKGNVQSDIAQIGGNTFNDAGAVGLHFWFPMTIKFYAKPKTGNAYIRHMTDTGEHLSSYDKTEILNEGIGYSYSAPDITGYDFIGSRTGYDTEPLENSSKVAQSTYNITYDGSFSSIYINFIYPSLGSFQPAAVSESGAIPLRRR